MTAPKLPQVFFSPCKVVMGTHTAGRVGEEVRQIGAGKVLVVTDPGIVATRLLAPIEESLTAGGIPYVVFDGVAPEPPSGVMDRGAAVFRDEGCGLVLGVGGGSSLDSAKGISILAANGGSIGDYAGLDRVPRRGAPLVLLPTTAGTGSEVTRVLVYTDERENAKNVVFSRFALADTAIVDPLMTLGMPPHVSADTGMDAFVHATETYVSMNATAFSDPYAERAIELIARWLPVVCAKGANLVARTHLCTAATLAGFAFGSGGLGAVHALAYPLGTEYHLTHGRTNAIMLPHVMRFNLAGSAPKYARVAALMGRNVAGLSPLAAAGQAVEAVLELLQAIGVSYRLRDYGIPPADLPRLVQGAMKQARLFVPNPRDLFEKDVVSIYEAAFREE